MTFFGFFHKLSSEPRLAFKILRTLERKGCGMGGGGRIGGITIHSDFLGTGLRKWLDGRGRSGSEDGDDIFYIHYVITYSTLYVQHNTYIVTD
jgi:hypothetical protein